MTRPSAPPWREKCARALLAAYKSVVSPALHAAVPGACRFQPACSDYAAIAVAEHGWLRGAAMAAWRVLRCNPLNRMRNGGFDPVPPKAECTPPGSGYGPQVTERGNRSGSDFSPQWTGSHSPAHR